MAKKEDPNSKKNKRPAARGKGPSGPAIKPEKTNAYYELKFRRQRRIEDWFPN